METRVGQWSLPFGERAELDFKTNTGAVSVLPVPPGEAPRLELRGSNLSEAQVLVRQEGRVTRVTVEQQGGLFRWLNPRDYLITLLVPPTITARISSDAGSIDARDLGPCDVSFVATAGRIGLRNLRGRIHAQTIVGQIVGEALAGSLSVTSNVGEVRLGVVGLDPGQHEVRTNTGAVTIELAPRLDARVETTTSIGSVKNYYAGRSDAAAVLRVQSDVGAIVVREIGQTPTGGSVGATVTGRVVVNTSDGTTTFVTTTDVSTGESRAESGAAASAAPGSNTTAAQSGPKGLSDVELEELLAMVQSGTITAAEAMRLIRAARGP
ncbi:MAG: hypothetical protein NZ518_07665 [Dehalococcoidia bacterium]|nr:hypothetical protein [Dehalococcoidia bacterium]